MNYRDRQEKKAISIRDELFHDPGNGRFDNHEYEFVLSRAELNLWGAIKEDALRHFEDFKIRWDKSAGKLALPTGHLLSSQVACINHLYFLRQHPELVIAILKALDPNIQKVCPIIGQSGKDEGFVAFEIVGTEPLGKETSLTRGIKCTSIDAMMIGETKESRILFLIEWKYTENYNGKPSKLSSGNKRLDNYVGLLQDSQSPITYMQDFSPLFYEPFYQLMRQTLLAWQMVKRQEYGANDWRHLHIIPRENDKLLTGITSPKLRKENATLESVWKSLLKYPEKYQVIDPCDFLKPIPYTEDTQDWLQYLKKRYWD